MSATIRIDAAPTDVWAILTDLSGYSDWNPLFRSAAGEVAPGNAIPGSAGANGSHVHGQESRADTTTEEETPS